MISIWLGDCETIENTEGDFFGENDPAKIAAALIHLRKRRGLNQKQVAEITRTKQPAISRAEQADYQNWNLNTLRSIADALDARVRVLIEPSEDIIREYDDANASPQPEEAVELPASDASLLASVDLREYQARPIIGNVGFGRIATNPPAWG